MRKKRFFANALIMTVSFFVLRLSGVMFRSFISEKLSSSGLGIFELIFSVFAFFSIFSSSGAHLASIRVTADSSDKSEIYAGMKKCIFLSVAGGFFAAIVLYVFAEKLSFLLFSEISFASSFKILSLGLPFISVCAALKGYFLSLRLSFHNVICELSEQFFTVIITVFVLSVFHFKSNGDMINAIMWISSLGEVISFAYAFVVYFIIRKKKKKSQTHTVSFNKILNIFVPYTLSSSFKAALKAAENFLIPYGLKKCGASASFAMERYGVFSGLAMPLIVFPSSVLSSFSSLLVPETAEDFSKGKVLSVRNITNKALNFTLYFSFFISAVFFFFSKELSLLFYKTSEPAVFLKLLAPILPFMYLDGVVDGILKGLDEQKSSMKYNFWDSSIRVLAVYFLLPRFGLKAYIFIIYMSTIFNVSLSLLRLLKVSGVNLTLFSLFIKPFFISYFSVYLVNLLPFSFVSKILICFTAYLIPFIYIKTKSARFLTHL